MGSKGALAADTDSGYTPGPPLPALAALTSIGTATLPWTPVLAFGGSAAGTSLSSVTGSYCVVGKLVFITTAFTISSRPEIGNDPATIINLPIPAAPGAFVIAALWNYVLFDTTYSSVYGQITTGDKTLALMQVTSASGVAEPLTQQYVIPDTAFVLTGFYFSA